MLTDLINKNIINTYKTQWTVTLATTPVIPTFRWWIFWGRWDPAVRWNLRKEWKKFRWRTEGAWGDAIGRSWPRHPRTSWWLDARSCILRLYWLKVFLNSLFHKLQQIANSLKVHVRLTNTAFIISLVCFVSQNVYL